jgi:hypothetical protein
MKAKQITKTNAKTFRLTQMSTLKLERVSGLGRRSETSLAQECLDAYLPVIEKGIEAQREAMAIAAMPEYLRTGEILKRLEERRCFTDWMDAATLDEGTSSPPKPSIAPIETPATQCGLAYSKLATPAPDAKASKRRMRRTPQKEEQAPPNAAAQPRRCKSGGAAEAMHRLFDKDDAKATP